MKRVLALLSALLMLLALPVMAEDIEVDDGVAIDIDQLDEEERPVTDDEVVAFVEQEDGPPSIKGKVPLYTTRIKMMTSTGKAVNLRYARDTASKSMGRAKVGETVTIYEVDPSFVLVEHEGDVGYVLRTCIDENCTPIDPVSTPPYGVEPCKYVATTAQRTEIYQAKSTASKANPIVVGEGSPVAILDFEDGFAKVIYWRSYGYIPAERLTDLVMVSSTEEPMSDETPIAAFSSFFEYGKGTEMNTGRVKNIIRSCEKMTRILQPGETLDFNQHIGPYKKSEGYFPAPVLINGKSVPGYGGGTCQSSSTLYNTIRQLPRINILFRRPHGPGSARYLPQHTDAAVGNKNLNLIFCNEYDFPLYIKAYSKGEGVLTIQIFKLTDTLQEKMALAASPSAAENTGE